MKSKIIFSAVLSSLLFLMACGGGEEGLDAKKKQLKEKETELKALNKEINGLKAEIAKLEPPKPKQSTIVGIDTLAPSTFRHFVRVQGQIDSDNNVVVSPTAQGTVTRVNVKTGQRVSRGQTLAQIDASVQRNQLLEMENQLILAKTVYEKQKNLWDQKIGTEIQFLQAKNNKEGLENSIKTLKSAISLSRVSSPISGIVDDVMLKQGQVAAPGMPAFRIVNSSEMKFVAELSESYIKSVKKGDEVEMYFPAVEEKIQAKIRTVSQTIDPINRTVKIEVLLPGKQTSLKTNMIGEITINDETVEEALVVPVNVVQKGSEGDYVMVANKGAGAKWSVVRKKVQTGTRYEESVVVESGLSKGDYIITDGYQGLNSGQEIEILGMKKRTPPPPPAKDAAEKEGAVTTGAPE